MMTDSNGTCVNASELAEGDLVAYAVGEASIAVAAHVQRCAACRGEAEAYRLLQSRLQGALLRRSCPPALTLGEYTLHLLAPDDNLSVAAHLAECPHCLAEQRDAVAFLAEPEPRADRGLLPALRRLLALPLRSAPLASGLRGSAGDESVTYEAEDVRITVAVQRASRPTVFLIAGLIEQPERFAGAAVRLMRDDRLQAETDVDDLGSFTFEGVGRGAYRLELATGDLEVAIDPLVAGPA